MLARLRRTQAGIELVAEKILCMEGLPHNFKNRLLEVGRLDVRDNMEGMGTFYAEQLTRFGFGDDVRRIREAWASGGSKAGTEAVSRRLLDEMGYVGEVAGARERLAAEAEAGADLHRVEIDAPDLAGYERTLAALAA